MKESCLQNREQMLASFYRDQSMEVEEVIRRWEGLAMDCLVNVFSRLNLEDRTLSAPFVCKSWYQASLDPQCWKVLNFRSLDLMPWSSFNARFAKEYRLQRFSFTGFMKFAIDRSQGSVVELAFPTVLGASLEDVVYASNECPRVKTLVLPHLLQQEEKRIPELITKWKNLERLEIGLKSSSFPEILKQLSLNCKNFTALKMYGWFNNKDAESIATHLPKLRWLSMSASFLRKEQLMVILDGCKELEVLDMTRCRGFYADDEIKKKASRIKSFKFDGSQLHEDYWDECEGYDDIYWAMIFGDY